MKIDTLIRHKVLMNVIGLKKYFSVTKGPFRRVVAQMRAVDNVSFQIYEGETLGLVGESGCGKTTTGRAILRLIEPTEGKVIFHSNNGNVDILTLELSSLKLLRRQMAIIFQDPYSSLNPRLTIRDIVAEPLIVHNVLKRKDLDEKVEDLLESVGLQAIYMRRYPHEFSGGQRQRIGIARALALGPKLIVADEPVSALDISVQAQVINLMQDLQRKFGLAYLFIAHDLSVVEYISNRVAVMYLGKIVELASTEMLYQGPRHPYTEALISSVPKIGPRSGSGRIVLRGEVPSPLNPPGGCNFHPRCPYAMPICSEEEPLLDEVTPNHKAACHFSKKLTLKGVENFNLK